MFRFDICEELSSQKYLLNEGILFISKMIICLTQFDFFESTHRFQNLV